MAALILVVATHHQSRRLGLRVRASGRGGTVAADSAALGSASIARGGQSIGHLVATQECRERPGEVGRCLFGEVVVAVQDDCRVIFDPGVPDLVESG